MFDILEARFLAPDVKRFRILAPKIAQRRQPGQFVGLSFLNEVEKEKFVTEMAQRYPTKRRVHQPVPDNDFP